MKRNNKNDLIEKLKGLESELNKKLKEGSLKFDENADPQTIKKVIKKYIKCVSEAKEILDKYEKIASEVNRLNADENAESMARAVVGMRKEPKVDAQMIAGSVTESPNKTGGSEDENVKVAQKSEESSREPNQDEIAVIDGKPIKVRHKRKQQKNREL